MGKIASSPLALVVVLLAARAGAQPTDPRGDMNSAETGASPSVSGSPEGAASSRNTAHLAPEEDPEFKNARGTRNLGIAMAVLAPPAGVAMSIGGLALAFSCWGHDHCDRGAGATALFLGGIAVGIGGLVAGIATAVTYGQKMDAVRQRYPALPGSAELSLGRGHAALSATWRF
jgi:hypothetical protein